MCMMAGKIKRKFWGCFEIHPLYWVLPIGFQITKCLGTVTFDFHILCFSLCVEYVEDWRGLK